jgi:hypothetical protein
MWLDALAGPWETVRARLPLCGSMRNGYVVRVSSVVPRQRATVSYWIAATDSADIAIEVVRRALGCDAAEIALTGDRVPVATLKRLGLERGEVRPV